MPTCLGRTTHRQDQHVAHCPFCCIHSCRRVSALRICAVVAPSPASASLSCCRGLVWLFLRPIAPNRVCHILKLLVSQLKITVSILQKRPTPTCFYHQWKQGTRLITFWNVYYRQAPYLMPSRGTGAEAGAVHRDGDGKSWGELIIVGYHKSNRTYAVTHSKHPTLTHGTPIAS